jgi:L-asparaginase II
MGRRGMVRVGSMTASDARLAPVAVVVRRGERVESEHRVAYAVADADGRLLEATGDVERPVFPRSAVKPLQALALVESGAADRFEVSDQEIALACASHGGEPEHVDLVRAWLARLGLDGSVLECGAHLPLHGPSAARLIAAERPPERVHNNCSGKHAGMITVARHLGVPVAGYSSADHPVQRRVAEILCAMTGMARLHAPAIDGCGLPTWPLPLDRLAAAMARLGHPPAASPAARATACARVRAAMSAHPHLVAGTGRLCTEIMAVAQDVLVKTGAEGVYAAALPGQRLGLALKVEDGAGRAAEVALLALLQAQGALGPEAAAALAERARPHLRNHAGLVVGRIEPAAEWAPPRQLLKPGASSCY